VQVLSSAAVNILELNRGIKSKWAIWDCAAIAFSERHTHVQTDEHKNTVATQPVFQLDRHEALGNVILLNVYCTTTPDPFKRLPFFYTKQNSKNKIELLTSLTSIHSLRLQYSKQTTETSHATLGAVRAFECGAYSSITSSKYLALGQHVCDDVTTVNSKK